MANHLPSPSQIGGVPSGPRTRVCGVNMHVLDRRCAEAAHQRREMRHSYRCSVFFLIKTFPFSCIFASCEQGPEIPSVGKSGSGDSGGRRCIYFQMLQGWSALISSHALAGMRGRCGEDAEATGSKDRGMFNAPGRVNESIFVQM